MILCVSTLPEVDRFRITLRDNNIQGMNEAVEIIPPRMPILRMIRQLGHGVRHNSALTHPEVVSST